MKKNGSRKSRVRLPLRGPRGTFTKVSGESLDVLEDPLVLDDLEGQERVNCDFSSLVYMKGLNFALHMPRL